LPEEDQLWLNSQLVAWANRLHRKIEQEEQKNRGNYDIQEGGYEICEGPQK